MSREAMKMALEAFGEIAWSNETQWQRDRAKKAITALKQALEQPEPEPVGLPEKIYEFVPTPEPAKWHHPDCEGRCIACLIEQVVQEAYGSQGLGYLQRHLTTPPQRKPLTDERLELIGHADLTINNIYIFSGYGEEVPEGRTPIYAGYKVAHGIKGEA